MDASGQPLPGVAVTWGVTAGSGELPSSSPTTNASGEATATWLLGRGEVQTVIVSSGQAAPATFTALAAPNAAAPRSCT